MVPISMRQSVPVAVGRDHRAEVFHRRWRPANVSLAAQAELRTLVICASLLGSILIATLLGYVWVRLKVVEAGYRLSATRQLVERLQVEGMELEVRVAAADNPARLGELAHRRLGMRKPERGEEAMLP